MTVVFNGVAAAPGQQLGRRPRAVGGGHQFDDLFAASRRVTDHPGADLAQFQQFRPLQRHVHLIVSVPIEQPLPVGGGAFQRAVGVATRVDSSQRGLFPLQPGADVQAPPGARNQAALQQPGEDRAGVRPAIARLSARRPTPLTKEAGDRGANHAQHGPVFAHLVLGLAKQVRPQPLSAMFRRDAQPAQTCHGNPPGPKTSSDA